GGGSGLGLSAAMAFIDLGGTVKASSGAHGPVGAGGLSVTADGTHGATLRTVNVATGLGAVGVTLARVDNSRSTEAGTTSSGAITFTTPAPVVIRATASNTADAEAPGGAFGGVGIPTPPAFPDPSGHPTPAVDGDITNATTTTISAIADNTATANTTIFGVSVVGISGGVAIATIGSGANIQSTVGSTATLNGSGALTVEAKTRNDGNKATANAKGGTGGLLAAGTFFVGVATIHANLEAYMHGDVTGASSRDVNANGTKDAEARTIAGSLSLGGALAGSVALAEVSGSSHVTASGTVDASIVGVTGTSTIEAT